MELQENYAAFQALDAEIIAIAQEEKDASTLVRAERFVKNEFPMVADPDEASLESIRRFGVTLVDKEGMVRTLVPGTLAARPRLDMIVSELAAIEGVPVPEITFGGIRTGQSDDSENGPAVVTENNVLDVRWMWSHDYALAGEELKLALVPNIADGYHVYGRHEEQMFPFKLELEIPEGLSLTSPIGYPKPHTWKDPGLGTDVQVYEGDIPMGTLRFMAADNLQPGKITVKAKLHFQACTDSFCLAPAVKEMSLDIQVAEKGTRRTGVVSWQTW